MSRKLILLIVTIFLLGLTNVVSAQLFTESFGSAVYDESRWTDSGGSPGNFSGDSAQLPPSTTGLSAKLASNKAVSFLTQINGIDTSACQAITVSLWVRRTANTDLVDLRSNKKSDPTGGAGYFLVQDFSAYAVDTWHYYTVTLTDPEYLFNGLRFRLRARTNNSGSGTTRNVWYDELVVTAVPTHTISGSVGSLDGVTMTGLPTSVVTSGGGSYTAIVTEGWDGVVTPVKPGYTFDPASRPYTDVTANVTGQDYTPTVSTTYTISGNVGMGGVTMNGLPGNPVSSGGGLYEGSVNAGWSGIVAPAITGYHFDPVEKTYSSVAADISGEDYTPTINTYTISGTVMTIDGVTMGGLPGDPVTSGGGSYSATVQHGWAGTVIPVKAGGYVFSPVNKSYSSVGSNQTLNFTTKDKAFTNASTIDNSLAQADNWNPAGVPVSHSRLFIFGDDAGAAGLLVNTAVNIGTAGTETGDCVFVGNGGAQTALMTVDTGASVIAGPVWIGKLSSGIVNFNGGAWNTPVDFRNWTIGDLAPGVVNMNGGTLTTGNLIVGSSGQVNMNGGKIQPYNSINIKGGGRVNIEAGTIEQYDVATLTLKNGAVIDINEGKLILLGNQTVKVVDVNGVEDFVNEGKITASGTKSVMWDYNITTTGKTTVWAQNTDPTLALIKSPSDEGKYQPGATQLSWTAGYLAVSHDVYLGTSFDDVNDAVDTNPLFCVSNDQAGTTHNAALELGVTYFWRIDENYDTGSETGTLKGEVWSFTTISQEQLPADPNLVGWWKFDDDADAMAWDYSGKGNHGTMKNTTFVDGKDGKAMNFVRASLSYVDVPAAALAPVNDEVTVALWSFGGTALPQNTSVFNAQNSANNRVLNAHLPWVNTGTTPPSNVIYWDAGNVGSAYDRINKTAATEQYKGQWNHWTFTKNAGSGLMKIYCNGILFQSGTGKTRLISGATKFKIGADALGETNNYDGMVDDFRIYNRVLSDEEIIVLAENHSAYNFSPANNTETVATVMLDWESLAANPLYNVYLSSNFDDVNDSLPDALIAEEITDSQRQATDLALDTIYYWAVDVNDNGTMFFSPVIMSFTTAKPYATNPSPANGTQMIAATQLSWTSTIAMISQDVYFGTDSGLVTSRDNSVRIANDITATSVSVGTLVNGATYYWLVDTTTSADVNSLGLWSFTAGAITDPNLVGWWKMDQAGAMAWDYSGYAHHGTFVADANIVADGSGYALSLNGTDEYVNAIGYKGVLDGISRTTCAWVKTTEEGGIISWGKDSAGQKWHMRVDDTFGVRTGVSGGYVLGTTNVADGQWHHIAAVIANDGSPTSDEIITYIDGIQESYSTATSKAMNTISDKNVAIGCWIPEIDYFDGLLKDVRIYNKALSQQEIWSMIDIDPVLGNLQDVVDNWLTAGPAGDLNGDDIVDLLDFNIMAQQWGWQD